MSTAIARRKQAQPEADIPQMVSALAAAARAASDQLGLADTETRNAAIRAGATAIREDAAAILEANAKDMAFGNEKKLTDALLDRLLLDSERIEAMADSLEQIAALPDPLGKADAEWERPNGLRISRVRVPLGVIGIIYESRPNVTADAGGLCLKAGNAVILRGGSESLNSSAVIVACLQRGLERACLPAAAVQMVPVRDREAVGAMLTLPDLIDFIVPRGGRTLIERVMAESRIPVIAHLAGICHVYVHEDADPGIARQVVLNAKMRRVSVCGAAETLLVDEAAVDSILPGIVEDLAAAGCEIRGDERVQAVDPRILQASEADWGTEYLDAVIAVKTVAGVDDAAAHIKHYGSAHTESIITTNQEAAERFLAIVDSAIVLHNASTQFADGGEFGMGAEIGIATGKLHARGPVGVEQLTSYKYAVRGDGQCRP